MALEDKARAQRIAALRKQKRLTQQAITEKLGVAYRTYQTWESLKEPVMPDWPNLEKLATFHGVKPEDIIGEAPDLAALMGSSDGANPLERIEENQQALLAEIETLRAEAAETEARIVRELRSLARKLDTAAKGSRTRKAR